VRWRGVLNEPGNVTFTTATVNGKPAQMLAGNTFEATLDMMVGANTVTVRATDATGNVRTNAYQVTVASNASSFTYDPNGNLSQKIDGPDTWTYEWDAENRLKRVLKNAVEQARFAYDPVGRRVEKVVGGVTTTYTYDDEDILRETTSTGTTLKYVHGPGIDEPLAQEDGAGALTRMASAASSRPPTRPARC
jgi:YD repeat-containing protein